MTTPRTRSAQYSPERRQEIRAATAAGMDANQRRGLVQFSTRQRVIVLEFPTAAQARAFDELTEEDVSARLSLLLMRDPWRRLAQLQAENDDMAGRLAKLTRSSTERENHHVQ